MSVTKSKAERVLVVESDDALRGPIVAVLSDAGYELSTDNGRG
jgi:DNA-binding response OmpR family regulator